MTDADETSRIDTAEMDRRIVFHSDDRIMEVDFSQFHFDTSQIVNEFYDRLEERIFETGEEMWFFLVNLNGTRIDPAAWFAYSRRGRALNLAHSMGSARFDASGETARQIRHAAISESFDPNLFSDRDSAVARLRSLPDERGRRPARESNYGPEDFVDRLRFDEARAIMEVDFSHFTFHHSRDVDAIYDHLEETVRKTGRRWFILVNLDGCQIMPAAWVRYALRGKRLNIAASLGSVRFAAGSETETVIRQRAESQGFRPNIRNTREEALELIEEMRAEILQGR